LQKEICSVLQEIRYLARLRHDNIVTYNHSWVEVKIKDKSVSEVHDEEEGVNFWDDSDSEESHEECMVIGNRKYLVSEIDSISIFIQMELCKETLCDYIDRRNSEGNRSNKYILDALRIFDNILNGVEYIHIKEGLIHRDLKPSNIFFTFDEKIKIGDLGLATKSLNMQCELPSPANRSFENDYPITQQSGDFDESISFHLEIEEIKTVQVVEFEIHTSNIGTVQYAAPEQLGDIHYDKKVDIYSIGLILLDLVYPYYTKMEKSDLYHILKNKRILDKEMFITHKELAEIILRCTEIDPTKRPDIVELRLLISGLIKSINEKNLKTSNSLGSEYSGISTNGSYNIDKRKRYLSEEIYNKKLYEFSMKENYSFDITTSQWRLMYHTHNLAG
jgi:serine/threonine protein kinase